MGRRAACPVSLSETERSKLDALTRRAGARSELGQRAQVVLRAADGANNGEIGRQLGISPRTVAKWRAAYAEEGVVGLDGRVGLPAVGEELLEYERVIMAVRAAHSASHDDPSTRALGKLIGLGQSTVSRIRRCLSAECPTGEQALPLGNEFVEASFGGILGLHAESELSALALRTLPRAAEDRTLARPTPPMPHASLEVQQAVRHARFWSRACPTSTAREFERWIMGALRLSSQLGGELRIIIGCSSPQLTPTADEAVRRFREIHWLVAPSDSGWFRILNSWLACQQEHDPATLRGFLAATGEAIEAMDPDTPRLSWLHANEGDAAHRLAAVPALSLDPASAPTGAGYQLPSEADRRRNTPREMGGA